MSRTTANIALLFAAVIWGGAFVVQKFATLHIGTMTFTGTRFLLGSAVILPLAVPQLRRMRFTPSVWFGLVATGISLFGGAVLQQIGIQHTSATNAGFLTTLYVPLVPVAEFFLLRRRPHPVIWPAAIGTVLGTWLLAGGGHLSFTEGDLWVLSAVVFWTAQVMLVGAMAARTGAPIVVALAQFLVCGIGSLAWGLVSEPVSLQGLAEAGYAIAYTGILSVGCAYTIQAVGQRYTRTADAAVILSSEALFASLAGIVFLGERLSPIQTLGCVVMFACILAIQLLPLWQERKAEAA